MKKVIYAIIGAILLFYISNRVYRMATLDSGLAEKIENGAIILDVRTEREYNTGHIDGSINISMGTIEERFTELDSLKTYITTCSHALRSVKVKKTLKEKGFRNVFNGGVWTDLEKIVLNQKSK